MSLPLPIVVIHFDAHAAGSRSQFFLVLAVDVESCVLEDSVAHGDAFERCLERYNVVADFYLGGAVYIHAYLLKHAFGEVHHPVVVLVGYVDFHTGKLRIVGTVHAFVAEVLGELVYTLESTYNEALEI